MKCQAESAGFTCLREAGHGDIHVDPGYQGKQYCNVWVLEPMNEDEVVGSKPMSGYRLLTDTMIIVEAE